MSRLLRATQEAVVSIVSSPSAIAGLLLTILLGAYIGLTVQPLLLALGCALAVGCILGRIS